MGRASWKVPWLFVIITTACAGVGHNTSPVPGPESSPSPQPSSTQQRPFVPTAERVGGEARLSLTFPDGTEALLAYPAHLDLAEMGVQPDVDLAWDGRWVGAVVFSREGPEKDLLGRVVTTHPGDPPIEEWTARSRQGRHQSTTGWLVFRLLSWTVHVPMDKRMEAEDLLGCVRPYETKDGYVALSVREPAELQRGYGEAGGPKIAFGDRHPLPDFVRTAHDGVLVDVAPSRCRQFQPPVQVQGSYGSACLDEALFVNGTSFSDTKQSQLKLADIVERLRLLELEPVG
jgi:hypothetical protein